MLDYIGHAQSFPDYQTLVHFPPHRLKPGVENVYLTHLDSSSLVDDISMLRPDLVFSFISHKPYLRSQGVWRDEVPIMRLLQGFRAMERDRPLYDRQCDRVITISVSQGLGQAFRALCPNSLNRVIPNAVDAAEIARITDGERKQDILTIFGYKNPRLAEEIQRRLAGSVSIPVHMLSSFTTRERFLAALAQSAYALLMPQPSEGFYLPVLEAFATNTLVVCPDARGNRDTLRDGYNGVMPPYGAQEIVVGVKRLLNANLAEKSRWLRNARTTVAAHTPEIERGHFRRLIDESGSLWRQPR